MQNPRTLTDSLIFIRRQLLETNTGGHIQLRCGKTVPQDKSVPCKEGGGGKHQKPLTTNLKIG